LLAKVDSALSGKKAALSFSWTVDSFPKVGPAIEVMPNQAIIATIAIQSGFLPFIEVLLFVFVAMGGSSLSKESAVGVKSISDAILITPDRHLLGKLSPKFTQPIRLSM